MELTVDILESLWERLIWFTHTFRSLKIRFNRSMQDEPWLLYPFQWNNICYPVEKDVCKKKLLQKGVHQHANSDLEILLCYMIKKIQNDGLTSLAFNIDRKKRFEVLQGDNGLPGLMAIKREDFGETSQALSYCLNFPDVTCQLRLSFTPSSVSHYYHFQFTLQQFATHQFTSGIAVFFFIIVVFHPLTLAAYAF
ncbi:MAG: hypothetical protein EZS28_011528 [Streblomastix strix]|uniref:Uncharacterized protein n=1 Tax=Streblomastix strix TaxID=222440 RepID=A0A5J4WE21_9EUKA|nr:MAG: hypothetical protein EZS28_011527 [Streblomastix strix]KAA6392946.1 MAG: hypothetical protein EZS28_011528 [Streblomastix strix]